MNNSIGGSPRLALPPCPTFANTSVPGGASDVFSSTVLLPCLTLILACWCVFLLSYSPPPVSRWSKRRLFPLFEDVREGLRLAWRLLLGCANLVLLGGSLSKTSEKSAGASGNPAAFKAPVDG